jgi:hypothetical protein
MSRIGLALLAIILWLGPAGADNWQNKITKPPTSVTHTGRAVCLTAVNCWCYSKRKTFTPGEPCQCGSADGALKYEGQLNNSAAPCH